MQVHAIEDEVALLPVLLLRVLDGLLGKVALVVRSRRHSLLHEHIHKQSAHAQQGGRRCTHASLISGPMAAAGSGSRPIAIPRPGGPRAAPKPVAGDDMGLLSQSLPPRAPVIGSLPAPKLPKNALMPDFALPPASPQAVSLLAAVSVRVGISRGDVLATPAARCCPAPRDAPPLRVLNSLAAVCGTDGRHRCGCCSVRVHFRKRKYADSGVCCGDGVQMPEVPVRTSRMAGVSSAPARSFLEEQSASAVKRSVVSAPSCAHRTAFVAFVASAA
jgi:hypothetical protein